MARCTYGDRPAARVRPGDVAALSRLSHLWVAAALAAAMCALGACESGGRLSAAPASAPETRQQIRIATGSGRATLPDITGPFFDITAHGAVPGGPPTANQTAINAAIDAAAAAGGGTVVVPAGEFRTYTIRLRSNVGLHLASRESILRAARHGDAPAGDGGVYDAPEPNPFVGLQDHGHSHWANSLIYGSDIENVTISGPGLVDGSYLNEDGLTVNVLSGRDPREVTIRTAAGTPAGGNKAIALKNARNIVLRDFSLKNGGHFGIIGTGVTGWTVDGIVVDTNRDALNIDASQDVTIRNSVFNSLTDDAIVLKASFGLGRFQPTQNVLIENCTVSGYDAGSVIDGTYSTRKRVATDRDGPTARIKLGTEGTTGFNTVTIRNVTFDRSRGFALESVDGAELSDITFTDVTMKNVSSSPIFIRLGDRGRTPVTGSGTDEAVAPRNTVRLDDRGWVLPDMPDRYGSHPAVRHVPSYDKGSPIEIGGTAARFTIVNPLAPTRTNPHAVRPDDPLFANAVGAGVARVRNIEISRVIIEDVDPRYPILIAGLVDHPIENVSISHVSVQYRGGLSMDHAVEQRQLDQSYSYQAHRAAPATQSVPWLVNTFFAKNEALLPRVSWDPAADGGRGAWRPDPYNVPEMPREYPEPSNFGILPAYGLYARHVRGLVLHDVSFDYIVADGRPAVVLDDVDSATFEDFTAEVGPDVPVFVKVTNTRKRAPVREYVKGQPYRTTTVTNLSTPPGLGVAEVVVDRPAPGTPPDSLYAHPTAPSEAHPYAFAIANADYPKPATVHRPFFDRIAPVTARVGVETTLVVTAHSLIDAGALRYTATDLPRGAGFDPQSRTLTWTPDGTQIGRHTVRFIADDDVIAVHQDVAFEVARTARVVESLDRGLVAIRTGDNSAYIGWRLLGTDAPEVAFNLYRSSGSGAPTRLNERPLGTTTDFVDRTADAARTHTYTVRPVDGGRELGPRKSFTLPAGAPPLPFLNVPLQRPAGGDVDVPPGVTTSAYTYNASDASVGDLDGDGAYDIVLKWDPSNARDTASRGLSGPVLIEAYRLDGTRLWQINLGRNIRAGAHYTQLIVYDFDGDGRAEVACKTADGTIDGQGKVIGLAEKDYRSLTVPTDAPAVRSADDARFGKVLAGPEYLTVFDGRTGAALATTEYIPGREPQDGWGGIGGNGGSDNNGNRVDRFLAGVAYLDGHLPSLIMARGYYGRSVVAAWDWRNGRLTSRWVFDSGSADPPYPNPEASPYSGQGNHSLSVADVDADGRDEIIYGAMVVDDDGRGLFSTGLRHGDASHVGDLLPDRPGLEVFGVHENEESTQALGTPGLALFDAGSGAVLWSHLPGGDVGRGVAADIDPRHPGSEFWTSAPVGLLDTAGNRISDAPGAVNFAVWWDADPLREILDRNWIGKWDWNSSTLTRLLTAEGAVSNNGSKATPALSADILGDWREEVVWRTPDNLSLRIYTTVIPAAGRLPTLMHDPQYRMAIAWQNVGYNQPPHPSFFLGHGMKPPPAPRIAVAGRAAR